jgi:hypothetical protein
MARQMGAKPFEPRFGFGVGAAKSNFHVREFTQA